MDKRIQNLFDGNQGGQWMPAPSFYFDFFTSPNPIRPTGLTTTTTIDADGTYVASTGYITQKTANVWPLEDDLVTLQPKGRPIWEARTNLLLHSNAFDNAAWTKANCTISADAVTSPDGTANADTMVATGVSSNVNQTVVKAASAITYTYSKFLKAGTKTWANLTLWNGATAGSRYWFNLATGVVGSTAAIGAGFTSVTAGVDPYGNGWYRCWITATSDTAVAVQGITYPADSDAAFSTATSGNVLHMFGGDLEAGAFPTPYIPTAAAAVVRSADAISIALPAGFNATEGTFFVEYIPSVSGVNRIVNAATDGSNLIDLTLVSLAPTYSVLVAAAAQCSIATAAVAVNQVSKTAFAYQANSFQQATNGTQGTQDTSGSLPTVTTLTIGSLVGGGGQQLNGWIRKLYYYPLRYPDLILQRLSR